MNVRRTRTTATETQLAQIPSVVSHVLATQVILEVECHAQVCST